MAQALDEADDTPTPRIAGQPNCTRPLTPNAAKSEALGDLMATINRLNDRTVGVISELERSRENAARSDQLAAVGQLAAGIAHELRNPLTAVKLLVQTTTERNNSMGGRELAVVQEEVGRMERMLQTFLDFARPPKLIKQPIEIRQLVEDTVEFVRPRAARHGVEIHYEQGYGRMTVYGDPQQIRQVVMNVLLNAVDAQPGGGRVRVEVDHDFEGGALACSVRVSDEGPGLSDQLGDTIFEPFVSTKETGVGLGLAICRRIVRSHGGGITANNGQAGGAQFVIQFPLDRQYAHHPGH
jgi:signal transduction histidine kinase